MKRKNMHWTKYIQSHLKCCTRSLSCLKKNSSVLSLSLSFFPSIFLSISHVCRRVSLEIYTLNCVVYDIFTFSIEREEEEQKKKRIDKGKKKQKQKQSLSTKTCPHLSHNNNNNKSNNLLIHQRPLTELFNFCLTTCKNKHTKP